MSVWGFWGESAALDVNADGYLDVVIPGNREDGRPCGPPHPDRINCSYWVGPNAIMMSNGNGTYRFDVFGDEQVSWATPNFLEAQGERFLFMGGSSRLVRGANNAKERAAEVYRLVGSALVLSEAFPEGGDLYRTMTGQGATYLLRGSQKHLKTPTIILDRWAPGPQLIPVDTTDLFEGDPREIGLYYAWNSYGEPSQALVVRHRGYDLVNPLIEASCFVQTPSGTQLLATVVGGERVLGGYDGNGVIPSTGGTFKTIKLFRLENGRLVEVDGIVGIDVERAGIRMHCMDMNQDGIDDIAYHMTVRANESADLYRISPQVFLSGGAQSFGAVPPTRFPPVTDFPAGQSTDFLDTDGDGLLDLIQIPLIGCGGAPFCSQYQLFRARRPLR